MAVNGTYTSTVSPSGPDGQMIVGGSAGAVTVSYAGTSCTVNQAASSGAALSFSYATGGKTYDFVGACANSTYNGTCVEQRSQKNRPTIDDNWTASSTGPRKPKP